MNDAADKFIEKMGLVSQGEGGPRIAGRIFGLMIVEGRAFSLQEIAERLEISKASASTNARLLANRGVLRLTSRKGVRQDFYELVPDPYRQMIQTVSEGMASIATEIAEAEADFPEDESGAKTRVRELVAFYRETADVFAAWAAKSQPGSKPR
ncbi:GbsR/MarR family transcriptional regulator [Mariluticola halotolerans]|uniref:GbsR/MarR family transcriptional regulator n=1 Tax=Mariluticola halotolerans TaxID=2909283 RepID=UPI0026E3770F|nr:hypothetical protein [Mariluticola halotolerans]UJQ95187.1 hypothetical protein L1P08_04165 [Mariluticola halotolerans]